MIVLAVLLFGNIGFFLFNQSTETTSGQEHEQTRALRELEEENERLQMQQTFQTTTEREDAYHSLEEQAKQFVHLVFTQTIDDYQTRKNEAPEVMNEELAERFFSSEMYGQGEVETRISEEEFFIQYGDINGDEMEVVVKLNHAIHYLERDVEESSNVLIRLTFTRQDGVWIASNLVELN